MLYVCGSRQIKVSILYVYINKFIFCKSKFQISATSQTHKQKSIYIYLYIYALLHISIYFMTNHEYDMVWIHYKLVRKPKNEGEGVIMNVGILAKLYRQARMAIMEVTIYIYIDKHISFIQSNS